MVRRARRVQGQGHTGPSALLEGARRESNLCMGEGRLNLGRLKDRKLPRRVELHELDLEAS